MSILLKIRKALFRQRGFGCWPNYPDIRDHAYEPTSLGANGNTNLDLEQYVKVVDQGSTSSCVGNAIAGAIHIMENKSGKNYGFPSRLFAYWNSRRRQGEERVDIGTYIRECCKAVNKLGIPDEKEWPFKTGKVNKQPVMDAYNHADPRKGGEYLAIRAEGVERVNKIMAAIQEGYPVIFGTALARSFMSASGPDIISRPKSSEQLVGRHALLIVGYRDADDGTGIQFRIVNSWGRDWRDDGKCWFSENYITWDESGDFTIIRGWKRIQG